MIEKETVRIHFHSERFDFLVLLMTDLPGRMLQGIEIQGREQLQEEDKHTLSVSLSHTGKAFPIKIVLESKRMFREKNQGVYLCI